MTITKKQWFYSILTVSALVLVGITLFNFWVDPLLQYRFSSENVPYLKGNNRHLNPGLVEQLEYDTLIMGTSMTKNIRPGDVNRELGGKSINLAMSGSSPWEQSTIINLALQSGKAKTILWGIDPYIYSGSSTGGQENLLSYLITSSPTISDHLKYLINPQVSKLSLKSLFLRDSKKHQRYFDIDQITLTAWRYHYSRQLMLQTWEKRINFTFDEKDYQTQKLRENYLVNIQPILEKNAHIQFVFFFPPYSILAWQDLDDRGWLDRTLNFKHWISEHLLSYSNVSVYDFQNDTEITHNLNNYKDLTHYSGDINRTMVTAIKEGKFRVSKSTRENSAIKKQLASLNIEEFTQPEKVAEKP